jgi:hypothetical protein
MYNLFCTVHSLNHCLRITVVKTVAKSESDLQGAAILAPAAPAQKQTLNIDRYYKMTMNKAVMHNLMSSH